MQGGHSPPRGVPQPIKGGPVRFGPYWLDARIAVGGTAEVYLARHVDGRVEPHVLVVKKLLAHFLTDPDGRDMFNREARLHAAVRHENVVTVFGAGKTDEGEPYLAMEYVEGVDGYRLLRRRQREIASLPVSICLYVARKVLQALDCVHTAADANGAPLGIIHRDVTPSNIYLSVTGDVKLGDFGIARSSSRGTMRSAANALLKGKFGYLAPEQVAAEPFDHRADLFSAATVLSEMLLNRPLFPGSGQLAVLLAIRDCRIEAVSEIDQVAPKGLTTVLRKALSRNPAQRYPTAREFAAALAPFQTDEAAARTELGLLVKRAQAAVPSSDTLAAVRGEAAQKAAHSAGEEVPLSNRNTVQFAELPSHVETQDGKRLGPWTFARLVEAITTGEVCRGDSVDYMGRGPKPVEKVEELSRFLPTEVLTTGELTGPGLPDFRDDLSSGRMLDILLRILEQRHTGLLFVESSPQKSPESRRKELYFTSGKLNHVASNTANELLGEYLVRRGKLTRDELDLALVVLPRHEGRMGETLITLGLVGPVDIFQAIREQGRDRVADLFLWREGTVCFYKDQLAPHVEFPLDLDLPQLILSGLQASASKSPSLRELRSSPGRTLGPGSRDRIGLNTVGWPRVVETTLTHGSIGGNLRAVVDAVAHEAGVSTETALCCVELLVASHLLVCD